MIRKIIEIDEKKCNGCAACVSACHEGAIGMVDGKAKLLRDDYCDGQGDCLPSCPADAIKFIEREALAYDEEAVKANKNKAAKDTLPCGCPGMHSHKLREAEENLAEVKIASSLLQWPVQIKLVPAKADYFTDADLLIAADCTAYAYGNMHKDFMAGRITLIGCPKLDNIEYSQKLQEILSSNSIKSVLLVKMEVPCCNGLKNSVESAIKASGKEIPLQTVTVSCDGKII